MSASSPPDVAAAPRQVEYVAVVMGFALATLGHSTGTASVCKVGHSKGNGKDWNDSNNKFFDTSSNSNAEEEENIVIPRVDSFFEK
jgi:hypothetical protein